MAKEDFCFTYYDGDAARDKAHMDRLERGAYDDLISAQRKFGHLSKALIEKVLGHDFERCWGALEIILKQDDDEKYFVEWLQNSETKSKNWADKSSNAGKRSVRMKEARKLGTHTTIEWLSLLIEARGICPRCKNQTHHFDRDHVIPVYAGGSDSIQNIQPLCGKCNSEKGPEQIDFFKEERIIALTKLQPTLNQGANQNTTGIEDGNGNGNGNKDEKEKGDGDKKKPKPKIEKPELIFPFNSENFMQVWGVLAKERKWRNKSHAALQASLKKLSRYTEDDAIAMINDAIAGEWQGLVEPKNHTNNGKTNSTTGKPKPWGRTDEHIRAFAAEQDKHSS